MSNTIEKVHLEVFETPQEMATATAQRIAEYIRSKTAPVLGLATGSTPLGVYKELIRLYKEKELSFANVTTFNLDEYLGLDPKDPRSYNAFMNRNLFDSVDIDPANVNIPNGLTPADRIDEFCREYEKRIQAAGGIGFQLLGIGQNGHIGFNESGSSIDSLTHRQELHDQTRISAAQDFFGKEHVPTHAITMGVGSILAADETVLLAQGEAKRCIVQRAVEGDESGSDLPANYLRTHSNAHFFVDSAAASNLTRTVAPWVMGQNPNWQELQQRSKAVIWLSDQVSKPISQLEVSDYNRNKLGDLLNARPDARALNAESIRHLESMLTDDPAKMYFDIMGGDRESREEPLRVMSMSPHPDDTEISMGGAALRHAALGDSVSVGIQTSGNIAVSDEKAAAFIRQYYAGEEDELLKLLTSKKDGNADDRRILAIKAEMRLDECRDGCEELGIDPKNVTALNLAFYETGKIEKDEFTNADVQDVAKHLQETKPHIIYAANDLTDPHGTHRVCMNILLKALEFLKDEEWLQHSILALYRGAWQEYPLHETHMTVSLTEEEVKQKQRAILKHDTQKPALFPGADSRHFDERVLERNAGTAKQFKDLGIGEPNAAESYVGISLQDFAQRGACALPKDLQQLIAA